MVAESEYELLEKFSPRVHCRHSDLLEGLKKACTPAPIFPILCTSAIHNIGIPHVLEAIVELLPRRALRRSEASIQNQRTGEHADPRKDPLTPFCGQDRRRSVYRRISIIRLYSEPPLRSDTTYNNQTKPGKSEKFGPLQALQGKTMTPARGGATQVISSPLNHNFLRETTTGDTSCDPSPADFVPRRRRFPNPSITFSRSITRKPARRGQNQQRADAQSQRSIRPIKYTIAIPDQAVPPVRRPA